MRTMPRRVVSAAHHRQEIAFGQDGAAVVVDRLQDDGRQLVAVPVEQRPEGGGVVEGGDDDAVRRAVGQAERFRLDGRRVGRAAIADGRPEAEGELVVEAVEMALELEHLGPAGEGAGDADGVERRLGAGGGEADHLEGGDLRDQSLGQADLSLAVVGAGDAELGRLPHRRDDGRVAVAEQRRAVGGADVDVLAAVLAIDERPVGARDVEGLAERGIRARGGRHAAWEHAPRPLVQPRRRLAHHPLPRRRRRTSAPVSPVPSKWKRGWRRAAGWSASVAASILVGHPSPSSAPVKVPAFPFPPVR